MTSLASWARMWSELGAPIAGEALHRQLTACWNEPHRHYHAMQHLDECLAQCGEVRHLARRPAEVALGLWFHDAFYDPTRADNEQRSADWAREAILQAGIAPEVATRVHALVMLTCDHAQPQDMDGQLVVDIDLAILGAERTRFDESNRQIRLEYAHVPEDRYREGRSRILRGFLDRPRLYGTDHFHALLDERARDNLRHALRELAR